MMKVKHLIAVVALMLTSGFVFADAPIAKIQAMLAKPQTLCGRFDQTKQLVGMKKPLLSSGRFCVVPGKGVLWRTLKPFPSTLRLTKDEIVNYQGDKVSMRLDASQEPAVRTINGVLFSLMAGDLGQLGKIFDMDGSIRDDSWGVLLKAKEPALARVMESIALEGGAYVKNITINEASGDRTGIVFSEMKTGDGAMSSEEAGQF
jgi:outer membrane lipoprotein-sorting protein